MCEQMDVPYLGAIPLDPRIGGSCDRGVSFLDDYPESPASVAYLKIVGGKSGGVRRRGKVTNTCFIEIKRTVAYKCFHLSSYFLFSPFYSITVDSGNAGQTVEWLQ